MHYTEKEFLALKELLCLKGSKEINILSDSMAPLLRKNESVSVVPPSRSLEPFDLIIFWNDNKLTCHFYWRKNSFQGQTHMITRSLKNPCHEDPPFSESNILGVVHSKKISRIRRVTILAQIFLCNLWERR